MKLKILMLSIVATCIFSACTKEEYTLKNQIDARYEMSGILEEIPKERLRNAILELTEVSKSVLTNEQAFTELMQVSKSQLHVDHYFALKDLLDYENSLLYTNVFVEGSVKGSYKVAFDNHVKTNAELYPNLTYYVERMDAVEHRSEDDITSFFEAADLYYYLPYTEEYGESNSDYTLVPSVVDADEALGYRIVDGEAVGEVMTNDDYAVERLTIIITPENGLPIDCDGGPWRTANGRDIPCEPIDSDPCDANHPDYPDCSGNNGNGNEGNRYSAHCYELEENAEIYLAQVFIGHATLYEQYDALISFTGNGGKSEIRIIRADGALARDADGDLIEDEAGKISKDFRRVDIRKEREIYIGSIWDGNWNCFEEYTQLFGVYEEDTEGDVEFSGNLTIKDNELFNAGLSIKNRSKDEIIRNRAIEHYEFFTTNLIDQGCFTKAGEYSFSDVLWPWYDCGSNFKYTMPHRFVD